MTRTRAATVGCVGLWTGRATGAHMFGTTTADTREAVILKHCRDSSLAEIAEHLGRTPAAAASLLHRGLKQLRGPLHEGSDA
jgi:DNA-directed RNA polymerase specialized sigma24 family protein